MSNVQCSFPKQIFFFEIINQLSNSGVRLPSGLQVSYSFVFQLSIDIISLRSTLRSSKSVQVPQFGRGQTM